jgi:hypothetical protein
LRVLSESPGYLKISTHAGEFRCKRGVPCDAVVVATVHRHTGEMTLAENKVARRYQVRIMLLIERALPILLAGPLPTEIPVD